MATNRLAVLQSMVEANPSDAFARYGLAMEFSRAGELETAVSHFAALLAQNPDYVAAYFHGGQTLEKLDRIDEARDYYRRGIEATHRNGDVKTRSELKAALDILG
jgi:tetratricopeptide (TPR) repeat protein